MEFEKAKERVYTVSEEHGQVLEIGESTKRLCEWEQVKDEVYPVLLPIKGNQLLLKSLVKRRLLDLAIVYVVRDSMEDSEQECIKISHRLFEQYGISKEALHEQAMRNLEKDNYAFLDLDQIALQLFAGRGKCEPVKKLRNGKTYMLRNCSGPYGAAGILNKKLLREIVGNKNCYIFPSSIHETVFMPVKRSISKKRLDKMVEEINADREISELLSDHCYFYEGSCGELKLCA